MPWVGVCGQFAGFQGFQGEKREYAFCRSSLRTGVASLMARFQTGEEVEEYAMYLCRRCQSDS
jgi:hypothetical protein